MSKIGLVIAREYTSRVKKKSFIILTILIPILIGAGGFLAMHLSQEEEKHYKVLVADPGDYCQAKIFVSQDEEAPATFYFTGEMVDTTAFRDDEQYKDFDMLIRLNENVLNNRTITATTREEGVKGHAERWIATKLETRLEEYFATFQGVSIETYRDINQGFKFESHKLGDDPNAPKCNPRDTMQGVGLGFSVMIFVFLMVYGGMVMRGVMEEKQGRVVEVIVSSVKPFELMFGKIAGIGLVGLTQFAIWTVLIFIIMIFIQPLFGSGGVDQMQAGMEMMTAEQIAQQEQINCFYEAIFVQINWPVLLLMFLVYFIGGYLLYGGLFAIVGAAADSEADTQQLVIPIMIPLTFVYILSFTMLGSPDSATALWGSQIPFSSPIIMLQRIAAGTVSVWEVLISVLLLAGAIIFVTYIAAKVYRVGILMYGKKVSWKEIIKWMRH